jgi:hypothetical protein
MEAPFGKEIEAGLDNVLATIPPLVLSSASGVLPLHSCTAASPFLILRSLHAPANNARDLAIKGAERVINRRLVFE